MSTVYLDCIFIILYVSLEETIEHYHDFVWRPTLVPVWRYDEGSALGDQCILRVINWAYHTIHISRSDQNDY